MFVTEVSVEVTSVSRNNMTPDFLPSNYPQRSLLRVRQGNIKAVLRVRANSDKLTEINQPGTRKLQTRIIIRRQKLKNF